MWDSAWYLCLPQQVDGESQPVRTAGLQLQGDEGQGQHGSSELQEHMRDKLKSMWQDLTWPLLPNRDIYRAEWSESVCVCVPVWVCGRPDSGRVGVWAGQDAESGSVPTWSPKTQNDTTTPSHGTMGQEVGEKQSPIRVFFQTFIWQAQNYILSKLSAFIKPHYLDNFKIKE